MTVIGYGLIAAGCFVLATVLVWLALPGGESTREASADPNPPFDRTEIIDLNGKVIQGPVGFYTGRPIHDR